MGSSHNFWDGFGMPGRACPRCFSKPSSGAINAQSETSYIYFHRFSENRSSNSTHFTEMTLLADTLFYDGLSKMSKIKLIYLFLEKYCCSEISARQKFLQE